MMASLYHKGSVVLASFFTLQASGLMGLRMDWTRVRLFCACAARRVPGLTCRILKDPEDMRRLSIRFQCHKVPASTPRILRPCKQVFDDKLLLVTYPQAFQVEVYPPSLFVERIEIDRNQNNILKSRTASQTHLGVAKQIRIISRVEMQRSIELQSRVAAAYPVERSNQRRKRAGSIAIPLSNRIFFAVEIFF